MSEYLCLLFYTQCILNFRDEKKKKRQQQRIDCFFYGTHKTEGWNRKHIIHILCMCVAYLFVVVQLLLLLVFFFLFIYYAVFFVPCALSSVFAVVLLSEYIYKSIYSLCVVWTADIILWCQFYYESIGFVVR